MPALPGPPPKRLIAIVEVAERLDVSVLHVRRLEHERRIPFNGRWYHTGDGPVTPVPDLSPHDGTVAS